MTHLPGEPDGIGTPPTSQPGFAPPAPQEPTGGAGWAPPDPVARVSSAPTGGRPVRRARPGRRTLVAAVLAGGLLLIGLLSALPTLPANSPTSDPSAAAAPPVVVTVGPSAAPTAAGTPVSGGGIGRPAPFSGPDGRGTLTVVGATWTDTGEAAPVDGERYLVVDLTIACTSGVVPVDPILLAAGTDTTTSLPGFGPALTRPLGGRLLTAGDQVDGQVGFALPPGALTLMLLDEDLHVLVSVEIPAP